MGFWRRLFGAGEAKGAASTRSPSPPEPAAVTPDGLKDLDDLRALIARCGFTAASAQIEALAAPCLDLLEAAGGHDAPLGASRLGGAPDLPEDTPWPATAAGGWLSFYGQIDLADPAVAALGAPAPTSGLLSLFVGRIEGGLEPAPITVLLTPAGSALERRALPGPPEGFDDGATARLRPVAVGFAPRLSFPTLTSRLTDALEAECPDGDIDALVEGLEATTQTLGQLFGHATAYQDDVREAAHFHLIGRPGQERLRIWTSWSDWEYAKSLSSRLANGTIYRPWSDKDDANMRWQLANQAQIDADVARLSCLLTVQSNKPMDLWINDADPVYVLVPAGELARGDLSGALALATQG